MCAVMAVARAMNIRRIAQWCETKMAQFSKVIQTIDIDSIFIFSGMDLWIMKFRMYGPSLGWFRSQS